jgi:transposase
MRAAALAVRRLVIARRTNGESPTSIARDLRLSVRTVNRWWQRWRTDGTFAPRPRPGRSPRLQPPETDALTAYLDEHPTATLAHLCTWLHDTHRIIVSPATMCRTLRRLGWCHHR